MTALNNFGGDFLQTFLGYKVLRGAVVPTGEAIVDHSAATIELNDVDYERLRHECEQYANSMGPSGPLLDAVRVVLDRAKIITYRGRCRLRISDGALVDATHRQVRATGTAKSPPTALEGALHDAIQPMKGAESLEASQRIDKPVQGEFRLEHGGWALYVTRDVPEGYFYVDPGLTRTFVNESTWETIAHSRELAEEFLEAMSKGSGMKRLVSDAGKYREAALAEAKAKGLDQPAVKDRLEALEEEANAIVIQAAGLNRAPTEGQLQVFAERLGELTERFKEAEDALETVRSAMQLAQTAVWDAAEH